MPSHAARFAAKVERIPFHSCWEWSASRLDAGYGLFALGGKNRLAHRVAWEIHRGPIPEGLDVLHTCDNPSCVNPDHLFLGTQLDNMRDKVRKGRHRFGNYTHPERLARGERHGSKTRPERVARGDRSGSRLHPESRPRGEAHGFAVLTDDLVRTIRSMAANGHSQRAIGRAVNTHQTNVSLIVRRRTWAHV